MSSIKDKRRLSNSPSAESRITGKMPIFDAEMEGGSVKGPSPQNLGKKKKKKVKNKT
jgi:hypothetical protein